MDNQKKDFRPRFNAFVGKAGIAFAILLCPFVFRLIFSTGSLRGMEWIGLMMLSVVLLALSFACWKWKDKVSSSASLVLFAFLVLAGVELTARLSLKVFASPETLLALRDQSNWTYTSNSAYAGHPFIQFTGSPSVTLKGNIGHSSKSPFNNFGFVGKDFRMEKTPGTIRIACLGESTTEDGYPVFLEDYLNRNSKGKFEAMNFGHAYWTTAHSLVNFMLNVQDFQPDWIVIHHGWNEERVRHVKPEEFRSDYSHAFKPFAAPEIPDRYAIRWSVIYRWIKFRMQPDPSWTSLSAYIHHDKMDVDNGYANLDELKPYRRNLENIIAMARLHHIRVLLTTLPHSTDPAQAFYYGHLSIEQCNAITRELAQQFSGQISFVDLDSLITGKHNEIFRDLGHVTDAGRTLKSQYIGAAILGLDSVAISRGK